VLPRNIAVPLCVAAQKIGAKPCIEYALSYALYNYQKIDQARPLDFDNLRIIRAFANNVDEHGFILVHVAMVRHSGRLVAACLDAIKAVQAKDRAAFNIAMKSLYAAYEDINNVMETMWQRSAPDKYMSYRTFIMGTKNQVR
jgi:indoleamine 2,3-dioxygenase